MSRKNSAARKMDTMNQQEQDAVHAAAWEAEQKADAEFHAEQDAEQVAEQTETVAEQTETVAEQTETVAPVAKVKQPTKKQRTIDALSRIGGVTLAVLSAELEIGTTAARSLIGDVRQAGMKVVSVRDKETKVCSFFTEASLKATNEQPVPEVVATEVPAEQASEEVPAAE